ncbi:hypothetical protein IEO21_02978 [Rhodonia placenta]|uniref:Uncharacterized protein n=2 Tax=Rhodonia placenta TaxID=104341 RepID=A0A8H7U4G5_9APHY|nr:hypothetical protein IEO21_02978 [Postia placenta]
MSNLHKINVLMLVTNGGYDETQDVAVTPLFELITRVRWYALPKSAHMAHWEERVRYMQVVGGFLKGDVVDRPKLSVRL